MRAQSASEACFFFSSRRRHTRCSRDWSSDVCSSDLEFVPQQLTSYGGLELLHRYVRRLGLYPRLRRACADLGGDYGGGERERGGGGKRGGFRGGAVV